MLEPPALAVYALLAHLTAAFGLPTASLAFLPLGADVNTAVYRVTLADGRALFLKLRRGRFDPNSVAVPAALSVLGLPGLIPPLRSLAGPPWSRFAGFTLTLYPFVAGVDGYTADLTPPQWVALGAAVRALHTAALPPALVDQLPAETYSPRWRRQVRAFQAQLRAAPPADPAAAALAAIFEAQAAATTELVAGAERLGRRLRAHPPALVVCHGDLHAGNVLLTPTGELHLVDWDTVRRAPPELDLMLVETGLGRDLRYAPAAAAFFDGYGPIELNPAAVAYYRCERIVQDLAAFCTEILSPATAPADRAQSLAYLRGSFAPQGLVPAAQQALRALAPARR